MSIDWIVYVNGVEDLKTAAASDQTPSHVHQPVHKCAIILRKAATEQRYPGPPSLGGS